MNVPDKSVWRATPRIGRQSVVECNTAGEAAGRIGAAFPREEARGAHEALVISGGLAVAVAVIGAVLFWHDFVSSGHSISV